MRNSSKWPRQACYLPCLASRLRQLWRLRLQQHHMVAKGRALRGGQETGIAPDATTCSLAATPPAAAAAQPALLQAPSLLLVPHHLRPSSRAARECALVIGIVLAAATMSLPRMTPAADAAAASLMRMAVLPVLCRLPASSGKQLLWESSQATGTAQLAATSSLLATWPAAAAEQAILSAALWQQQRPSALVLHSWSSAQATGSAHSAMTMSSPGMRLAAAARLHDPVEQNLQPRPQPRPAAATAATAT